MGIGDFPIPANDADDMDMVGSLVCSEHTFGPNQCKISRQVLEVRVKREAARKCNPHFENKRPAQTTGSVNKHRMRAHCIL